MSAQDTLNAIQQASKEYGIDPKLMEDITRAEVGKSFDYDYRRSNEFGATGPFQIMEKTYRGLTGGKNIHQSTLIEQARASAKFIKQNIELGLTTSELQYTAYNAGPGYALGVKRLMSQGMSFETAVRQQMEIEKPGNQLYWKSKTDGRFRTKAQKVGEIIGGFKTGFGGKQSQYQVSTTSDNPVDSFFDQTSILLPKLSAINPDQFGVASVRWFKKIGLLHAH